MTTIKDSGATQLAQRLVQQKAAKSTHRAVNSATAKDLMMATLGFGLLATAKAAGTPVLPRASSRAGSLVPAGAPSGALAPAPQMDVATLCENACLPYEATIATTPVQVSLEAFAALGEYSAQPPLFQGIPTSSQNGTESQWVSYQPAPKNATLFDSTGLPQLSQIDQGEIGDCFFLAMVGAVLAKNPQFIASRFTQDGVDPVTGVGRYTVTMSLRDPDTGKSASFPIKVDDQLPHFFVLDANGDPMDTGPLAAATPPGAKGPVLWAALIEKAFAKANDAFQYMPYDDANQGYQAISEGGWYEAFKALTGGPASGWAAATSLNGSPQNWVPGIDNNNEINDSFDFVLSSMQQNNTAGYFAIRTFDSMTTTSDMYGNTQYAPGYCASSNAVNFADGTSITALQGEDAGLAVTSSTGKVFPLFNSHAYTIVKVDENKQVTLRNPWGFNPGVLPDGTMSDDPSDFTGPEMTLSAVDSQRVVDSICWGELPQAELSK